MPGISIRLSRRVRDKISCTSSACSSRSGSTKVSATCRSKAVSSACQNCSTGVAPCSTSSRYRPPAMLAPGTSCRSSAEADESSADSCGASNAIGSRVGSPAKSLFGRVGATDGATVPIWTSAATSGWKSSAAWPCARSETSGAGVAEELSEWLSATSDPFRIPPPAMGAGGSRRTGCSTRYPPGVNEFLRSEYVTWGRWGGWSRATARPGGGSGSWLPPNRRRIAACAARASGTSARSIVTATIGTMSTASTASRSSEPGPPCSVRAANPSSRSAT
ncbi:hypothetical protein C1Y40_05345 [Mycobacterium talmoniae]|uniref:Uncharacterized protein n=1 Tax=Mycobacterium talmoniae TaxID=1858794 RepID=A0A2S8BCX9_9MYCO|nr:hypothetical protein C1Y40_05345 [Mycobacterium talmoniae]